MTTAVLTLAAGKFIHVHILQLKHWLRDGRAAYRSANNVICVYAAIPLTYIHNVIGRHADKELLTDDDWPRLKSAAQANRLEVTSSGLWLTPQESVVQISLTPQGRAKLLSRERETPSDRGVVPFDVVSRCTSTET